MVCGGGKGLREGEGKGEKTNGIFDIHVLARLLNFFQLGDERLDVRVGEGVIFGGGERGCGEGFRGGGGGGGGGG